jgi:hypothetical protein
MALRRHSALFCSLTRCACTDVGGLASLFRYIHRGDRTDAWMRSRTPEAAARVPFDMANPNNMNAGDWIDAAKALVEAAAVVVGAAWAYWKFVRGRIFHSRAELDLTAELVPSVSVPRLVRAQPTLRNTGASDIPKATSVLILWRSDAETNWERLRVVRAFRDHDWLESGETISDDILIRVKPSELNGALALRVTCLYAAAKKQPRLWFLYAGSTRKARKLFPRPRSLKGTAWTAIRIIPLANEEAGGRREEIPVSERDREAEPEKPDRDDMVVRQREISDEAIQRLEEEADEEG